MQYHRPATVQDAIFVAANLRSEDRAECLAASGIPPEMSLPAVAGLAEAIVAPDGEVIGLCGVMPTPIPGNGTVWMLGTTSVAKYSKLFIRAGKVWLEQKHQRYARLGNVVDARNMLHVRWLAAMGFKFTQVIIHGPQSLPFIQFERTTKRV
jgi:hypothetical protein